MNFSFVRRGGEVSISPLAENSSCSSQLKFFPCFPNKKWAKKHTTYHEAYDKKHVSYILCSSCALFCRPLSCITPQSCITATVPATNPQVRGTQPPPWDRPRAAAARERLCGAGLYPLRQRRRRGPGTLLHRVSEVPPGGGVWYRHIFARFFILKKRTLSVLCPLLLCPH